MAGYKFGNKANFGENTTLSGSFQYVFGSGNSNSADHTMVGGISNTVTSAGEESFVWGSGNTVSGSNNIVGGQANTLQNGNDNMIVGGSGNTSQGSDYSIVGGRSNTIGGKYCIVGGSGNTMDADGDGDGYHIMGGKSNTSNAYYGLTIGQNNTTPDGQRGWITLGNECNLGDQVGLADGGIQVAGGKITTAGDAMLVTHYTMRGQTTNNTSTQINNGNSANFKLAASTTYLVVAHVSGRKAGDAGQSAAYRLEAVIKRDASNNTTMGTTGVTKTILNEDTGVTNYDATIVEDDTNEAFAVKVTGDTGHNVNWFAHVSVNVLTVV